MITYIGTDSDLKDIERIINKLKLSRHNMTLGSYNLATNVVRLHNLMAKRHARELRKPEAQNFNLFIDEANFWSLDNALLPKIDNARCEDIIKEILRIASNSPANYLSFPYLCAASQQVQGICQEELLHYLNARCIYLHETPLSQRRRVLSFTPEKMSEDYSSIEKVFVQIANNNIEINYPATAEYACVVLKKAMAKEELCRRIQIAKSLDLEQTLLLKDLEKI